MCRGALNLIFVRNKMNAKMTTGFFFSGPSSNFYETSQREKRNSPDVLQVDITNPTLRWIMGNQNSTFLKIKRVIRSIISSPQTPSNGLGLAFVPAGLNVSSSKRWDFPYLHPWYFHEFPENICLHLQVPGLFTLSAAFFPHSDWFGPQIETEAWVSLS